MSQYEITVKFTRELEDDKSILEANKKEVHASNLVDLLIQELQKAYDDGYLGGSFKVIDIQSWRLGSFLDHPYKKGE